MKALRIILALFWSANILLAQHDEATLKQKFFAKTTNSYDIKTGEMYDVKHYRLNLSINPNVNSISGTVSIFLKTTQLTQTLTVDLRNNMTVDWVKWNDNPVSFIHSNHIITITTPSMLPAGTYGTIEISYNGTPQSIGFGAWTQTTHNGTGVIWTLSEPYGAYTWWPCKNNLSDKADSIDVIVRTPHGNKVASNGILYSVSSQLDHIIYHWKHRHPIATYLIAVAVTNYVVFEQQVPINNGQTVRVVNYCYPESQNQWQQDMNNVVNALQFFSQRFIPYPFANEKYGHAQFGWGGGMEHQTMSFMYNLGEMLVVHELSHQWFGNYITCGTWADIWLNESFARYCEGLYLENRYGESQFRTFRMEKIGNVTSYPDGSVYCYDTTSVSSIFDGRLVYDKGGMVLHMLRKQIGNQAFWTGIHAYLNDTLLAGKFARTGDVKRHFEQAADTSLTEFFNDWIFHQGFPTYNIEWQYLHPNLYLRVNQTQSHSSVSYFEMKIPIKATTIGRDTTFWVHNLYNGQVFILSPSFQPTNIAFDPDFHLISRYNTVTQSQIVSIDSFINEQVKIFPNPTSRQMINITSAEKIRKIFIYSLSGQVVQEILCNNENIQLKLPKGVFILKIELSNQETIIHQVASN
ncbi:MAG TPA: M1 family aminopeptidase [Salinivirgaceae bacterium]|nr:M1 family aminopeptidase [Salinivirgaceae bacterium]